MIDLMTGGVHDRGAMLEGLVEVLWTGFTPRQSTAIDFHYRR